MDTAPEAELLAVVSELCGPLHQTFEGAAEGSARCRQVMGLTARSYNWLGTHQTRALAHLALQDTDLGGWRLAGMHSRNGELWLSQDTTTLRLLHAPSPDQVPAPGPNRARRAYYCNPPLPGLEEEPALLPCSRLLGLWRVTNPSTYQVGIRIVRTVGTWKFRALAQTDLDVLLPRVAEDFEGLEWTPNDAGMELEIPADETEEGEGEGDGIRG